MLSFKVPVRPHFQVGVILPCGKEVKEGGFPWYQEAEGDWSQGFYSSRRPGLCRLLASGLDRLGANLEPEPQTHWAVAWVGAGSSGPLAGASGWRSPRVGGTTDGACCLVRRTLERSNFPRWRLLLPCEWGDQGNHRGGAIRLVLVCGSVMSGLGWALRMFPQKQQNQIYLWPKWC